MADGLSLSIPYSPPSGSNVGSGVGGFFHHLANDIKGAVFGLPTAALALIEHPIRTGENIVKTTWHLYSPLFHGHLGQFAHNVYDHPLAPLLDAATVFSLGLGAAAKVATVAERAGSESATVGRLAGLTKHKTVALEDMAQAYNKKFQGKDGPAQGVFKDKGYRTAQDYSFSTRPMRRLTQEAQWKAKIKMQETLLTHADHIPSLFVGASKSAARHLTPQTKFEKLTRVDLQHRASAKNLWVELVLHAGRTIEDPAARPAAIRGITMHHFLNFVRHAPRVAETDKMFRVHRKTGDVLGLKNEHYAFVKDFRLLGGDTRLKAEFKKATRVTEGLNKDRARYAPLANALPQIKRELVQTRDTMEAMLQKHIETNPNLVRTKTKAGYTKLYERNAKGELSATPFDEFHHTQEVYKRLQNNLAVAERHARKHQVITAELDKTLGNLRGTETQVGLETAKDLRKAVFDFDPKLFEAKAEKLGSWGVTDHPHEAMRDANGHYLVVAKQDVHNLGRELGGSVDVIKTFWRSPATFWKRVQIGYTPRTVTQNFVGNYLIAAMRDMSIHGFLGMMHSVGKLKGGAEAAKLAAVGAAHHPDGWIFKWFGDELGQSFGQELKSKRKDAGRLRKAASSGFYPIVAKTSETPIRLGAIFSYLQKHPAVQSLMKEKGYTFDRAAQVALKHTPGLRREAANYSRTIAGDYITKGPMETVLSDLVPFYLWDKHIVKSMGNTLADNPERIAVMQRFGQEGYDTTKKLLGDLPEFLRGAIPGDMLPFLKNKGNARTDVFLTNYLNPFAQIGDLTNLAEGVATGKGANPGEAIASQLNPFLAAGAEYVSGKSLLTGADIKRPGFGGLPAYIAGDVGRGLPFARLASLGDYQGQKYGSTGKPLLYSKDKKNVLSSLLGFPIRDLSLDKADTMAQAENTAIAKQFGQGPPKKYKSPFSLTPPL